MMEPRIVRVSVRAGERQESLIENQNGSILVSVRAPAAGNAANHRVREMLAEHFKVSLQKVRLKGGPHQPRKTFIIHRTP